MKLIENANCIIIYIWYWLVRAKNSFEKKNIGKYGIVMQSIIMILCNCSKNLIIRFIVIFSVSNNVDTENILYLLKNGSSIDFVFIKPMIGIACYGLALISLYLLWFGEKMSLKLFSILYWLLSISFVWFFPLLFDYTFFQHLYIMYVWTKCINDIVKN